MKDLILGTLALIAGVVVFPLILVLAGAFFYLMLWLGISGVKIMMWLLPL